MVSRYAHKRMFAQPCNTLVWLRSVSHEVTKHPDTVEPVATPCVQQHRLQRT